MNTEYLPSFVKDLKALKSTPVYTSIKTSSYIAKKFIVTFPERSQSCPQSIPKKQNTYKDGFSKRLTA
jgi:hypothetical protein